MSKSLTSGAWGWSVPWIMARTDRDGHLTDVSLLVNDTAANWAAKRRQQIVERHAIAGYLEVLTGATSQTRGHATVIPVHSCCFACIPELTVPMRILDTHDVRVDDCDDEIIDRTLSMQTKQERAAGIDAATASRGPAGSLLG
ncbi:hypothetical protein [Pararhodobacter zhoushanensis]|uniref:hypothetical protein n=1 Tax=Pararhodobacter zhoushanensis TaxID=2479545 RepID=UPI000F8DEFAE|nr:hypothetical protein [Pararhodobacter zhoushanensis]